MKDTFKVFNLKRGRKRNTKYSKQGKHILNKKKVKQKTRQNSSLCDVVLDLYVIWRKSQKYTHVLFRVYFPLISQKLSSVVS